MKSVFVVICLVAVGEMSAGKCCSIALDWNLLLQEYVLYEFHSDKTRDNKRREAEMGYKVSIKSCTDHTTCECQYVRRTPSTLTRTM